MNLKELEIGKTAVVTSVGGDGALRQHFLDMGIIPGVEVTIVKYAPRGDPMRSRLGRRLAGLSDRFADLMIRHSGASAFSFFRIHGNRRSANCSAACRRMKSWIQKHTLIARYFLRNTR